MVVSESDLHDECMIERLALSSFRHRWRTLLAWIALVAAVIVGGSALAGDFANGGRMKGTDSDDAYELLGRSFPAEEGSTVSIAYSAKAGLQSAAAQEAIDTFIAAADAIPRVDQVSPPAELSADETVGVGSLRVTGTNEEQLETVDKLRAAAKAGAAAGVEVDYASYAFVEGGLNSTAEVVGVMAAVVILLLAFGSIVAMGVPIISALMGVAAAASLVGVWAAIVPTPEFTTQVALMIGLGVGIDYALFIITRYRRALAEGATAEEAIVEAMGTAGRAVVFAGSIVMVSLLGMILIGLEFLNGLALGSATAVLIAVLSAVTLVPALLGIMGKKIGKRAVKAAHSTKETMWHRWARFVQRRAAVGAAIGTVVLLALAAPIMVMRLASADLGNTAKDGTARIAYDRLADAFGPGVNGPLIVAVDTPSEAAQTQVAALEASLTKTPGVARVLPPQFNEAKTAAQIVLFPTTSPQSEETSKLVHRIRDDIKQGPKITAHVGGQTASDIDFADLMGARLPLFIGSVLVASFVLLMLVFRSILVPLKAVLLNLLSIGTAYGLLVMVFQWGWFGSVFGVEQGAPIEPWAPMMLFAIVFGLSMDYEVFLLSSVHERFRKTGNNSEAVVEGLASTARVITAAAAIMIAVFGAFVANDLRSIKLIGFGLAAAVLVDATLVRMLLVPATMELLGAKNWWMPRWLDRILPKLHIESTAEGEFERKPKSVDSIAPTPKTEDEPSVLTPV
jgi:putative drug exporter of the RND superfamily